MSEQDAGRALDLLIAVEVMGIARDLLHDEPGGKYVATAIGNVKIAPYEHYSTSIAAAFDVVEKLRERYQFELRTIATLTHAGDTHTATDKQVVARFVSILAPANFSFADTAPLAICRAALSVSRPTQEHGT